MGESDGAGFSVRDNEDDKYLREQPAEHLQPPKFFQARSREHRD